MNHLNAIFSTAQRLQASRSFLRDLRGLDKTAEGAEFAKAIGEAAALGATPEDVVEQVVKAMAGNEGLALEILMAVQEIAKAHVEHHTRTLANGKTVDVKAYETARTGAMKQTTMAHGATFHAMRTKTPEAHENAAAAHEAAAKQHEDAHGVHPMDVPEVGKEHANLKAQHQMSADYHRQEAATMRHGHGYEVQANRAVTASQGTKAAITTHQSQMAHQKAAEEHKKAHEFDPGKGHDQQAAMHTAHAQAAQAVNQSMNSPHQGSDVKGAADASLKAFRATTYAHEGKGLTRDAHAAAAKAHEEAINQHMGIHGAKESDEDGHHGQIAKTHMALHAYHSAKAQAKTPEEVAKAQVEGYTRVQDGKVIHVGAYDSKRQAAFEASRVAHEASLTAKSKTAHTAAAALHGKAIAAHREAWNVTNHEGRRSMHDANMAEHGDMISGHRAMATAGGGFEDHPFRARAASNLAPDVESVKPGEEDEAAAAHDRAGSAHVTAMDAAGANRSHHSSQADQHAQDARKIRERKDAPNDEDAEAHEELATSGGIDLSKLVPGHNTETTRKSLDRLVKFGMAKKDGTRYTATPEGEIGKAEGPMTTLGGGTDLATKSGGAALAVEGRPGKEGRKKQDGMDYCDACDTAYPEGTKHECPGTVAKAHVESHTRVVGGKTVQVQSYDTHHAAAMKASFAAQSTTAQAQNPEHHTHAAASHMKAAEGHREAAKYAPEDWQKKGHEDNAKLHEHYAQAHHAKAKAADQRADTGVDTPQHTPQDLKELENHHDYAGFGYLGHEHRTDETDKHLTDAANKAGISKHELAAHALSKSGRHMMDDHTNLGEKASEDEKVAHFQRHLTSPKTAKEHGIKEYAKDLEERAPAKPAAGATEPVTVKPATPEKGYRIPPKPTTK